MNRFVIITPAHNEQDFIEKTIVAMINQTTKPLLWVIVDDGSSDQTADVVARYAAKHSFIKLISKQRDPERNFARKVAAFDRGLQEVKDLDFDFIGNIDADISFAPDYFERILDVFEADAGVGIAGGIVHTRFSKTFKTYDYTPDSVGGKVQLFRRRCFEDIGGYLPLKFGGIDATAEIMARMHGWCVRKSLSTPAYEHRPTGFAYGNPVAIKICEGRRFYSLGYHPLFYFMRCLYRIKEYPFVIGSGAAMLRYLYGMVRREPHVLPPEVIRYLRNEQGRKLWGRLRLQSHA